MLMPAAAVKDLAKIFTGDEIVRILFDGSMVWFVLEKPAIQEGGENTETDSSENADNSENTNTDYQENADSGENTNTDYPENDDDGEKTASAPAPKESYLDGTEFSLRSIEANFPKYERILNEEIMTTLTINRSDLLSALDRVAVIAKNTPAHIIAMTLKPGSELLITARAPGLGTASETLEPKEVTGKSIQIGFNLNFLNDGLKAASSEDVYLEFSEIEGQTRIYCGKDNKDFLYMLMPIRLTPQDIVSEDDNSDFAAPEDEQAGSESQQENYGDESPQESQDNSNAPF